MVLTGCSVTSNTFLALTKRGNVLKIVREHYLRDDLWCGSMCCSICHQTDNDIVLEKSPESHSSTHTYPHYLVLDTNVILNQIDVLEEDIITNVIILYTVLNEVKHRSSSIYKRLNDIIGNPKRKFYIFVNEHHKETYVERMPGEKENDRNDRAIRVASSWYGEHISLSFFIKKDKIKIVLLTDDADNLKKACESGIIASTVRDYVKSFKAYPGLEDKLSHHTFVLENNINESLFPPHLTPQQIHDGIKTGKFLQGTYYASRENFLEGSVNVEGHEKFILVQGREGLNRAVDGDVVAIELLPEDKWTNPSEIVLEDVEDDPGDILEDEEIVLSSKSKTKVDKADLTPTGMIVGIIRRKWRQYCGILQPSLIQGGTRHLFVPAERKIPKVRIETRQAETLKSQRIIVAIDSWPRNSRYPLGHFVRALGKIGDKDTENEVLLLEHDVPHSKFSEAVLSFLPKLPWVITEKDVAERVDLRHLDICSVDPPGCTDIDDALHCRSLPNGNYEVGVHIADVSHFIRPGNAMDKEAANRATTVYLIDKRIDMVPDLLSSNLCSLRGGEDRFAFSCVWEMDENANIISTKFHKSIIKSRLAMTYEEAQLRIDDKSQNDAIAKSLRNLNNFAKTLKKRRIDNGALVLASMEIRFQVDSETHDPIEVEAKKQRETNSMVEEFMLLANISVAQKIDVEFPECAMLRRHPEPPQANFTPLIKAGQNRGYEIITTTGGALAKSLNDAVMDDNPFFNTMLRILATRCMMQAVYFASGTLQKNDFFHYGLACPIYTHFTSPIRRYADIIVHRLLAACIGADSTYTELLDRRVTSKLCENLNYRNRMAQYAGRASVALNTHLFFRGKVQREEGYILFVRKNALQILIPKFGLEGIIYVSGKKLSANPKSPKFSYSEEQQTQTYGDVVFHSFDPVTIQLSLDTSNVQHEKIVLQLVKPYIEGFSVGDDVVMDEDSSANGSKRNQEEIKTPSGDKQGKKKRKSIK
ncbi:exosome complex exonuclease RRP44-like protein Dis3 [Arctopsyche grandis]|uniref:exosome complex exonuclease RRP44-like protein Dis3 n=1 Tax=Arctopsyche grandis TaxID=121162 RepID=UPI00406D6C53